jgi:squalene-hopene/tetraprenyl-beta-curcumene cyclase
MCVSCHTVVPYAIVRSSLGRRLFEPEMPAPQRILMASVETRVQNWSSMPPFYSDAVYGRGKTAESRATEAVLNAVILASYDAQHGHLRSVTRTAFKEAWALQDEPGENRGGWKWQNFHLAPFESVESGYQGAALLMQAVKNAPDGYAREPQIQEHVIRLQEYLRGHYAQQPLLNQIYILWLSPKVPGLLTTIERTLLLNAIQSHQEPDGGWILSSLDPQPATSRLARLMHQFAGVARPVESDGYATGLVVMALKATGTNPGNKALRGGLDWLERHQEADGSWRANSLNGRPDPASDVGRFMRDAATAYAAMALENSPLTIANSERNDAASQ